MSDSTRKPAVPVSEYVTKPDLETQGKVAEIIPPEPYTICYGNVKHFIS